MTASLRIHLLGAFRLVHEGEVLAAFDQARLQALLAYLILRRNAPVSRQQLAFLFWPDSTEEQARTNLRNLLHRLRRTLPGAERLLAGGELTIQWWGDAGCWVDVAEFEAHLQTAPAAGAAEQITSLEQGVALYGGDLLAGCYDDWVLAERDRLSAAYSAALERLADLHEERRNYRQALGHVQALLRHDPLHEPGYAQLMRLHALDGDRAGALHAYHTCATLLRRELDVEPAAATRELYERLLSVSGALSPPAGSVSTAEAGPAIPLVGRDAEWTELLARWREAATRPALVVISGEAGIGKTRLAEALVEWVGRQGIPALSARCYAAGGALAYAPLVTWLRGRPTLPLPSAALRELARLLPEIAAERPDLPPPEPLTENWQRLRLFEALCLAIAGGRPAVLLFLDDPQWSDRDTLDWLHFLLTGETGQGEAPHLLVVTTWRSGDGDPGTHFEAWRADLAGRALLSEIELGPLSVAATLALAGRVAGRPLDPRLGPALYRGAEGHPLFIVEMVRAGLGQTGPGTADHAAAMTAAAAALPARVRQVLDARLAQLTPPARSVIEVASVIGRAFTYDVLARAAGLSEDLLVGCLDECWRKRIIREQGADGYDFSHDKLREAAYASLSRTRRRWLHGRVAQALEQACGDVPEQADATVAAHHEAAGHPEKAIEGYARAAAASRRIYAHAEALSSLERAAGLLPALDDAAPRCRWTAHVEESRGDVRELLAQHGLARAAYESALACAPADDLVMCARLQRKAGKTLESERAGYDEVASRYEAAEALLGEPYEDRDPAWWEEWCAIQVEHLLLLYWWALPGAMAQRIERVQPLIEAHGTPYQRASLYSNLSRQVSQAARFAPSGAAVAHIRAALAALPAAASPEIRGPYQFALGFYLLWHTDYAESETSLLGALALAEQTADVSLQARCLAYLAVLHRRQGHDAQVETWARRGLAAAESAGAVDYAGANQAHLAWLAVRRGDLDEAERLGAAALNAWTGYRAPYPLWWQALWPLLCVALSRGRTEDAVACARRLLDPKQQVPPPAVEAPLSAALVSWEAGDAAAAHGHLARGLALAQETNYF